MIRPALATIVAVAALALVVAGCGGSSSGDGQTAGGDSGETASTLTKSEFLKQADAICAKARKEVEVEFAVYLKNNGVREIGEGEPPAEAKAHQIEVIEKYGIPALRRQQAQIEALGLPKEGGDQVKTYLAEVEKSIEEGERNPVRLYNSSKEIFAKSDKVAGELGLKVCGNR